MKIAQQCDRLSYEIYILISGGLRGTIGGTIGGRSSYEKCTVETMLSLY